MICNMDCLQCDYPDCINSADDEKIHKAEYKRLWRKINPDKYEQEKQRISERMKKLYCKRKEAGLCVKCGKPIKSGICCSECKRKASKATQKYRRNMQYGRR